MKQYLLFLCLFFQIITLSQTLNLELLANGLNDPTELTHAGDERMFVTQQNGLIKILYQDGSVNAVPFLDITNLTSASGERGLLGLAFSPNYSSDGRFYVNYTNTQGNTVIARYTVSDNPDVANANGEILMTIDQPFGNHNGGCLRFGLDGMLYISLGDGGSFGDPLDNGQDINSLLGKMLRINVDMETGFSIPDDNPFVGMGGMDEIWAYGLRNAWKFTFDAETNEILIADVGQNEWEEINREDASIAGINYGWRCYEGDEGYNLSGCGSAEDMVFPVAVYVHQSGRCSISGGHVYRGEMYTNLQGKYIFADYCSNDIGIVHENNALEWVYNEDGVFFTGFGIDYQNEMYAFGSGKIFKIIGNNMNVHEVSAQRVYVSPNPTQGTVHIFGLDNIDKIELFSLQGKLIKVFQNTNNHLDISQLPKSVYVMQIQSEKKLYTFKIIKN